MNGFELIIFDGDGVLVDSERIANEVFAQVLNEEDRFSLMVAIFVGYSSSQCMNIIETMHGTCTTRTLEA